LLFLVWKVSISNEVTEEELKEQLQTKLGISKDYFRIFETGKEESKSFRCNILVRGQKYQIRLGKIPNCDESKVDVYILKMGSSEVSIQLYL
jgi:hypothetical protein